jgi:hypothetical protein
MAIYEQLILQKNYIIIFLQQNLYISKRTF